MRGPEGYVIHGELGRESHATYKIVIRIDCHVVAWAYYGACEWQLGLDAAIGQDESVGRVDVPTTAFENNIQVSEAFKVAVLPAASYGRYSESMLESFNLSALLHLRGADITCLCPRGFGLSKMQPHSGDLLKLGMH